jgi:hypothetical protein
MMNEDWSGFSKHHSMGLWKGIVLLAMTISKDEYWAGVEKSTGRHIPPFLSDILIATSNATPIANIKNGTKITNGSERNIVF